VADAVLGRSRAGKRFSIIAMAEGALSKEEVATLAKAEKERKKKRKKKGDKESSSPPEGHTLETEAASVRLARHLQNMTRLDARVTTLGHLQRGGVPSPTDRLLATRLGTACVELIKEAEFGVMVASKGQKCVPVPLKKVAGRLKTVPPDHAWIRSARLVGTCFGD
jgi:6-phosphofructokinase